MKKIYTYSLITVIALFLGISTVSAEEETPTVDGAVPAPALFRNSNSLQNKAPARVELKRKTELREAYKQRLESFVDKYKTQKENFASTTLQARERLASTTQRVQEKLKENKAKIAEKKGQLKEKQRERIKGSVLKIADRFDNILNKIVELQIRIEERISIMKERGLDLSEARASLEEVPLKITEARASIEAIRIALDGVLNSDDPKAAFREVRGLIEIAKTAVKEAHTALIESIKSIKASIKTETEDNTNSNNNEGNTEATVTEDTEELCSDTVDNDNDGNIDLDDSDCDVFQPEE